MNFHRSPYVFVALLTGNHECPLFRNNRKKEPFHLYLNVVMYTNETRFSANENVIYKNHQYTTLLFKNCEDDSYKNFLFVVAMRQELFKRQRLHINIPYTTI